MYQNRSCPDLFLTAGGMPAGTERTATCGLSVLVGAPDGSPALPSQDPGAAYLYTSTGSWDTATESKLVVAAPLAGQQLGSEVRLAGTTMAVGAAGDSQTGPDAGAAFLF